MRRHRGHHRQLAHRHQRQALTSSKAQVVGERALSAAGRCCICGASASAANIPVRDGPPLKCGGPFRKPKSVRRAALFIQAAPL